MYANPHIRGFHFEVYHWSLKITISIRGNIYQPIRIDIMRIKVTSIPMNLNTPYYTRYNSSNRIFTT